MTELKTERSGFSERLKDPDPRPGIVRSEQIEKTLVSFLEIPISRLKSDAPDSNYTGVIMNVLWKYYSPRQNSIMRVKDWIYLAMTCIRSGTEIDPEWFHEKLDIRIAQTLDPAIHALFYYPYRGKIKALKSFFEINSECLFDYLREECKSDEYRLPDHTADDMIEAGLEMDIDEWLYDHRYRGGSVISPSKKMCSSTDLYYAFIHYPVRMLADRDYLISLVESVWVSLFYDYFAPIYHFAERRGMYDRYKNILWDEGKKRRCTGRD